MSDEKPYTLTCSIQCHPEPREIGPAELRPEVVRMDGHFGLVVVENGETREVITSVRGAADQDDQAVGLFLLRAWAEVGEGLAREPRMPAPVREWMRRTMADFDRRFTSPQGPKN